jgi:hypothetical protein
MQNIMFMHIGKENQSVKLDRTLIINLELSTKRV